MKQTANVTQAYINTSLKNTFKMVQPLCTLECTKALTGQQAKILYTVVLSGLGFDLVCYV